MDRSIFIQFSTHDKKFVRDTDKVLYFAHLSRFFLIMCPAFSSAPRVSCPTYSRTSRATRPTCFRISRASYSTCFSVSHASCLLYCHASRTSCPPCPLGSRATCFTCPCASRALVSYVLLLPCALHASCANLNFRLNPQGQYLVDVSLVSINEFDS